jgi:hypothetical protein
MNFLIAGAQEYGEAAAYIQAQFEVLCLSFNPNLPLFCISAPKVVFDRSQLSKRHF